MDMNTEELTNKIKEVIKELVENKTEPNHRAVIENGEIWAYLRFYLPPDLEMVKYFEQNLDYFTDYYFEEYEKRFGLEYVRTTPVGYFCINYPSKW